MIAPLSLSNVITVFLAAMCLWTIVPQSRGGVVRLWRLAIPASFAAVEALMLLASVFDATPTHDGEWLGALVVGGLIGRMRGWSIAVEVDQAWGLVRLRPAIDGVVVAGGLAVLAAIDFVGAAFEEPILAPQNVASGAALCAGFIGFRALATVVRAMRAPHVELHDAERMPTSV
ncbi:MAG: hypothetical protein ACHQK9_17730 [Reyranellales bacterium]